MYYNLQLTNVIPDTIEKNIIKAINKKPPQCYAKISDKEISSLEKEFVNNITYQKYNITIDLIKSIRSSFIKNKMINKHFSLIQNTNKIIKDYNEQKSILQISKKYDGSPLNILRIILSNNNSKEKVKKMFNKPELLNEYDFKQFLIAKENDDFALVNQNEILDKANLFEEDIGKILSKNNINYKTQEILAQEQIKLYGKPINTPDFLIDGTLKINDKEIKWIDAKNFYGSDIKFVKSKINEQTQKYIKTFGNGCIIFKLGFNDSYLNNPNILFLSWNSFKIL